MKNFKNPVIFNTEKGNTSDPYVIRSGDFYYHCYADGLPVFGKPEF